MKNTIKRFYGLLFILILTLAVLTGCGGGGGGGAGTTSDTTPPTVLSTIPANNATGVAVNSIVTATFSESLDSSSITSANFHINGLTAEVSAKCSSAFLHPTNNFSPITNYIVTITGVKDSAGNTIAAPYLGTFTTANAGPPALAIAAGDKHTTTLKSDGTLWAWGNNTYGQLGDGTTTDKTLPTQIGAATNWKMIVSGGNHNLALKTDGTLWAWGANTYGQFGDGTIIDKTLPTQIGTASDWSAIAGHGHTLALKTDGTLWGWGFNGWGQLGDGTIIDKTLPTQIGADSNWSAIATGPNHSLALKSDGTLWAWGYNVSGQLGDGTIINKSVPTQIGSGIDWSAISAGGLHSLALKTNGTLWAWGGNASGQLGNGTTFDTIAPAQIGTATNWGAISGGYLYTVARKSDGTLWAWGDNSTGQLGDGTTVNKTAPGQIGSATNWGAISAGIVHTVALKTDGTLWTWGGNTGGQLGDGTTTPKTTPAQIDNAAATVAATPAGVTATAGSGQLTVAWSTVPGATSYDLSFSTSPAVSTTTGTAVTCVTSPYILTGLAPGTAYYVVVVASNGYGESTPSSAATATPTGGFTLNVSKTGPGSGTVTSAPAGIDCGATCSDSFAGNSTVTLTATPAAGSAFAGWGGACSGTGACTVTMNAAKTVTATFNSTGSGPPAPASCFTTTGNICMSITPPITITCTDIPPGFLMACSATVPMNITSAITTGTISVGVATGGTDYIKTTINVTPNTAPGAITAQIPLTSGLLGGCTTGLENQFVEVYDGEYRTSTNPGGRQLLVESVQANMVCN